MLNNWIFVTNERDDRGKIGKYRDEIAGATEWLGGNRRPDTKDAAKDPKNRVSYPFPFFFPLSIEFIEIFNFPTFFFLSSPFLKYPNKSLNSLETK